MPGFNPENINIHDLTIEEPEKQVELAFYPEKEITQKEHLDFFKLISRRIHGGTTYLASPEGAAEHIQQLETLGIDLDLSDPKKAALDIVDLKTLYDKLSEKLENSSVLTLQSERGVDLIVFLRKIGDLIGKKKNFELPTQEELQVKMDEYRKEDDHSAMMKLAVSMKKIGLDPKLSKDEEERMLTQAQSEEEQMKNYRSGSDADFARGSAHLIAPAKMLGLPLRVSEESWEVFRSAIDHYHNLKEHKNLHKLDIAERILDMYHDLSVLSAEKVEFKKDGGVKLVKKPELASEVNEIPEQRKF